jgi:glutathione synthase/RimK-type ligase-like ATP-grasp enzyme
MGMLDKTLVVVDDDEVLPDVGVEVLSFSRYLSEYPRKGEHRVRVLNLCHTERYLSKGYYCSLLAEARQHRVLPSVNTINDLRNAHQALVTVDLPSPARLGLSTGSEPLVLDVFFGRCADARLQKLAARVFSQYPAPLLRVTLRYAQGWRIDVVRRIALTDLEPSERERFNAQLREFITSVWRQPRKRGRAMRWNLAILMEPDETLPPSDKGAIRRMIKAASKVNIEAELITQEDYSRLTEYDALFIRTTTSIDHYTYRFARKAELSGMVVIDDPTSILRCCNKVYLHDAFSYSGVPSPRTRIYAGAGEAELDSIEAEFGYPLVLKVPESAFSRGVFKVRDRAELAEKLKDILKDTALVLVQEYLYTEFDWRIGVLRGRAIYACRYLMAPNHWQIYNHGAGKKSKSGGFETLPTFEVPRAVLDAALKACAVVGRGLYGVDVKQRGNQAFVIEVNDNPSIEHGVEDAYLGDELYMLLMSEFANSLESRGR